MSLQSLEKELNDFMKKYGITEDNAFSTEEKIIKKLKELIIVCKEVDRQTGEIQELIAELKKDDNNDKSLLFLSDFVTKFSELVPHYEESVSVPVKDFSDLEKSVFKFYPKFKEKYNDLLQAHFITKQSGKLVFNGTNTELAYMFDSWKSSKRNNWTVIENLFLIRNKPVTNMKCYMKRELHSENWNKLKKLL